MHPALAELRDCWACACCGGDFEYSKALRVVGCIAHGGAHLLCTYCGDTHTDAECGHVDGERYPDWCYSPNKAEMTGVT